MAVKSKIERDEAINRLHEWVKPGDTLYTVLRHRSSSGMSRVIDVISIDESGVLGHLGWNVAEALERRYNNPHEGVSVQGCGMDMGFELVYSLSSVLFPSGFDCIGEACPANDHSNVRPAWCAICGEDTAGSTWHRSGQGSPQVCSEACAHATWHHKDGGYAIRQRWI